MGKTPEVLFVACVVVAGLYALAITLLSLICFMLRMPTVWAALHSLYIGALVFTVVFLYQMIESPKS